MQETFLKGSIWMMKVFGSTILQTQITMTNKTLIIRLYLVCRNMVLKSKIEDQSEASTTTLWMKVSNTCMVNHLKTIMAQMI